MEGLREEGEVPDDATPTGATTAASSRSGRKPALDDTASVTGRSEPVTSSPMGSRPGVHRRYRRRELVGPDGARLVLSTDGTLTRFGPTGTPEGAWAPGDPEWPGLVLRFGVRVEPPTVSPTGRLGLDARRPGG